MVKKYKSLGLFLTNRQQILVFLWFTEPTQQSYIFKNSWWNQNMGSLGVWLTLHCKLRLEWDIVVLFLYTPVKTTVSSWALQKLLSDPISIDIDRIWRIFLSSCIPGIIELKHSLLLNCSNEIRYSHVLYPCKPISGEQRWWSIMF